jgi:hypothetical protein
MERQLMANIFGVVYLTEETAVSSMKTKANLK